MAQLRDSQTSQAVFEGSPLEAALVAAHIGDLGGQVVQPDEAPDAAFDVLFDDVGLGFDPDAVREAHQADLDALRSAAADPDVDDDTRAAAAARVEELEQLEARIPDLAGQAQTRLAEARARVG